MSTEKMLEGLYRTNSSMTGRNSKHGPEKLDTQSVVQTVGQDDPPHCDVGGDQTRRTLKVCKRRACLVYFFRSHTIFGSTESSHSTHWNWRWIKVKSPNDNGITETLVYLTSGTIGTVLFVQIGSGLTKGGPGMAICMLVLRVILISIQSLSQQACSLRSRYGVRSY